MKNRNNSILFCFCLFWVIGFESFSSSIDERIDSQNGFSLISDEIIFYTNGSSFSPVIILEAGATVVWTWDDNTTSTSTTPVKNYGSAQLRTNRLKVTPWSSVRRINIGYDGQDGGTNAIEFVADQHVSVVENLNLVAPYLREWCSSYNAITSLDFSNFINLETIECYLSTSLNEVNLTNTPKLKRACFEDNNLLNLNLSDCNSLEDLRASRNRYTTFTYPNFKGNMWHICVRSNPQLSNPTFFTNLSEFPDLTDLFIWDTNQQGNLIINKTHSSRPIIINASWNKYSSLDLTGSLQNPNADGYVNLNDNQLTSINISGCIQINNLNLNNNKLESNVIDLILEHVDDYGTSNGTIDLRNNKAPSYIGLTYKNNLETRGWVVQTEPNISIQSITVTSPTGNLITTDNGTLQLQASVLPDDATTKAVTWSVTNLTGRASISTLGLLTAERNGTVKATATAADGSGIKGELQITISNQIVQVESIVVNSPSGNFITTDNGTLQLQASVLPDDATSKSVTWSVTNLTGRASISTLGLLTAERNGTVKATATAADGSGIKGELQITISNQIVPVESIAVTSPSGNLITTDNGSLQLQASVLPDDATTKTVTWSVTNLTGRASISTLGLLTAERNGTVKATATAAEGSGIKGELLITISNQIVPVESITIQDFLKNDTIKGIGSSLLLNAVISPQDATNKEIDWSVENISGIGNIDLNGLLTTVSPGIIKVIAKSKDESKTIVYKEYKIVIPVGNQITIKHPEIKIFPNPTKGRINIEVEKIPHDGLVIEIRNLLGQILFSKRTFDTTTVCLLYKYPPSIYYVTVIENDHAFTQRVIKSN